MAQDFLDAVGTALHGAAEQGRAMPMRAYMRGQFDFIGVPTPQRRLALRPLFKPLKGAARVSCWATPTPWGSSRNANSSTPRSTC